MKKILLICFLALLCLFGSETKAKVASPGAYSLLRLNGPYRGGVTLSDTFNYQNDVIQTSDIGHPSFLRSPVSGLPSLTIGYRSSVIPHPTQGFSLVDNPGPPGQEESTPSARKEGGTALIYGELINPDSLGPLTLDLQNGLISGSMSLETRIIPVPLFHGTFFDGVLDPRVRKFLMRIPISGEFATFRLKLGERVILKDMFISPDDSLMVGIDLQNYSLVFGGPEGEWFEAQYAVQRATTARIFQSPRVLLEKDQEALLDQDNNRHQWESQNREFGARLAIDEFGKSGLDQVKKNLDKNYEELPEWVTLQNHKSGLNPFQLGLLESRLLGAFYSQNLGSLRKFHYGMPKAFGDTIGMNRALAVLPAVLDKLEADLSYVLAQGKSPEALQFAREWVLASRILNPLPYPQLVSRKFEGLTRDRLLMGHLIQKISTGEMPVEDWEYIGSFLTENETKAEFEELRKIFQTGKALDPLPLTDLLGNKASFGDFRGKPALVYFYFTGCAHSGNYFRNYLWPFYKNEAQSKGVQLIAVSVDKDPELWKRHLSDYSDPEINNLNALGPSAQEWLRNYRISAFPRTLLLDAEGKVLAYQLGGENYSQYRDRILFLLENQMPISIPSL